MSAHDPCNILGEPLKEAATPQEMRAAIFEYQFRGRTPLVRAVMQEADYSGLSSEDRYTALAYHALKHAEAMTDRVMHYISIHPGPWIVEKDDFPTIG